MAHHVLLIDPSKTRERLAERLRLQGYTVSVTADVGEGAHMALSDPPAIVVAELRPKGDISGVQLCRLLRSEPATEGVPVILRGEDQRPRDRFWAERAGASAYVSQGSMAELVGALARTLAACPPPGDSFFTQLSGGGLALRDRIASQLDIALFESVIASEVRALSVCGSFDRLFDLLSQFLAQLANYRWMAVYAPGRFALHTHPSIRLEAEAEARALLGVPQEVVVSAVEDEDAHASPADGPVHVRNITLGMAILGQLAVAPRNAEEPELAELVRIVSRELGGPLKIATLMEESGRLAKTDPLAGLLNRRAFLSDAEQILGHDAEPACALLLDVDHFKVVNDTYGHAAGDAVVAGLGRLLPTLVRRTDVVGRWGGEEFVVLLAGATEADGVARAEAIRIAIAAMVLISAGGHPVPITASIGVASRRPGEGFHAIVARADDAMYAAKAAGRNRVSVARADPPHTSPTSDPTAIH